MRMLFTIATLLGASGASAAGTIHYLEVINTADSSLVSFAVAPAGTDRYKDFAIGAAPLQGGGNTMTVAIGNDDGGCLRDLRATFANGRSLIQQNFNVCKYRSYHTGRYLRKREPVLTASQP